MTLTMKKMDLFKTPSDYAYCHCISADIAMGAGIAVKFRDMGVKQYILNNKLNKPYNNTTMQNDDGYCIPTQIENKVIYNLVTKNRYYHKPTIQTLRHALEDMYHKMKENHIQKIAMPMIGCGLDRLNWNDVRSVILDVFENTDTDIVVCYL